MVALAEIVRLRLNLSSPLGQRISMKIKNPDNIKIVKFNTIKKDNKKK